MQDRIKQIQAQINNATTVATRGTSADDIATMLAAAAAVASAHVADDGAQPAIDLGRVYIVACPLTR